MPKLIVQSRDGARRVFEVSGNPLSVGRAESCDIVLRDDAEVSREHAQIWLDEQGHILVADANSKNGTGVDDGEVFRDGTRRAHQIIRIGEHEIVITGAPSREAAADTAVTFLPDAPTQAGNTRFFPSSKGLDLNQQRLSLLMSLADRIGGAFERKQLLEQALGTCCEALNFERGLIALKTARGEAELPVTHNVEQDETGAYKVSRTLINRALIEGERAVVNNPATDLVGNLTDSLVRFPICSALCVPILYRDEILGVVYGDRITRAATYTPADVDFLAAIAQQVGVGLANLRLFQEHVRMQKVYAELEAARRIQRGLLPAAPLQIGPVTVDGYNEPSSAVGGDYFDYFDLGDGLIGFVIADVTGHGLPAALVMANLQAAVHLALTAGTPLPDLATLINRLVCRNTASGVFITAILGTINASTRVVEYVNAGHPLPMLVGGPRMFPEKDSSSLPLGIEPDESYTVQRICADQRVHVALLYTDGLSESEDPEGELLGLEPVVQALSSLSEPTADAALRAALAVVREHLAGGKSRDDLTLLAIQLREHGPDDQLTRVPR